jgi:hypothetical protein
MYRVDDQLGRAPVVVLDCDVCGQPINEADTGGPVSPRVVRIGKDYLVRHAHAGRCLEVLEEELAKEYSQDLSRKKDTSP